MNHIDIQPTHMYEGFRVRLGRPYPFGATIVPGGINFSIFSHHANSCVLVLFEKGKSKPLVEIPFQGMFQKNSTRESISSDSKGNFRIGNVFTMTVFDLDYKAIEYGFRLDGPYCKTEPGQPGRHRFDPSKILLDPYAKAIGGRDVWGLREPQSNGKIPDPQEPYPHRARLIYDNFDWADDHPLDLSMEDLVIYEMHVRSFTAHPSAKVKHGGTFTGIAEKIPYFKELGVNCLELMPIYEFDEFQNSRPNPKTGSLLMNYWGYSPIGFFALKAGYAVAGKTKDGTLVANEFKALVKELHRNGIEVILDLLFGHTAEADEYGATISYRGIDNPIYYMLTPEGYYYNFSKAGNTLNSSNPIVREMVLEALRYWVSEYHVDGFRFDLSSILGHKPDGGLINNPSILEALAIDPILSQCKLIAGGWNDGGLSKIDAFMGYGRWAEWNGNSRDTIRRFLQGERGQAWAMGQVIQGSPNLYTGRGTMTSINFVTCHDGFTLADLVSYSRKHNEVNNENNNDGISDNYSLNCGWEGQTDSIAINTLRRQQMKNAIAMLLVSQGVPMILMGDEVGRTQRGNNNSYCQDNELNWLNWTFLETNKDLFRFFKNCLAFRHAHPVLRNKDRFQNYDYMGSGYADITWHGTQAWHIDWSGTVMAFMLCGKHAKGGTVTDNYVYVAMNMHWDALSYEIPILPPELKWHLFVNTSVAPPHDIYESGSEPPLKEQHFFLVGGHSVVILLGK